MLSPVLGTEASRETQPLMVRASYLTNTQYQSIRCLQKEEGLKQTGCGEGEAILMLWNALRKGPLSRDSSTSDERARVDPVRCCDLRCRSLAAG